MSPPLCPLCRMPAHASETNDRDEHPECARRERARLENHFRQLWQRWCLNDEERKAHQK